MKRFILISAFLMISATVAYGEMTTAAALLPPQQQSPAFQKYQKRPKNELSKIIYLMDRFKGTDYKVMYDNMPYDSETALQTAKNYIAKHYHQEKAEEWIKDHSYRSKSGQIIYLLRPDGKTEILRDALIGELKQLGS